jgi:hypothetical protein
MRRRFLIVSGLALLLLANGCQGACTLIGCTNGLIIQLSADPKANFRVEVRASMGLSANVYECNNGVNCGGFVFFQDYYPETAIIKVITPSGTREVTVTPEYKESFPNGKGCGSACRSATVPVALP